MKITFENQIKVLTYHLWLSLLVFVILAFLGFQKHYAIGMIGMWVLFSLPILFLHLEYYSVNKGMEINISDERIIIKSVGGSTSGYDFNEIDKIVLYKPASLEKGGAPIMGLEYYHFARVTLKGGNKLIITCLMTLDLEGEISKIKGGKFERRRIFFASPGLYS